MRPIDRIYRTFEEFEREELRRTESVSTSVGDMMGSLFDDEPDSAFTTDGRRKPPSPWDDED